MKQDVCPTCGRGKPGRPNDAKRNAAIVKLSKRGQTPEQIGVAYNLSGARVRAIIREASE